MIYVVGVVVIFFVGFFLLNVLVELMNIMVFVYLMLVSLGLLKLRKMFGKLKVGEFKVLFVFILLIVLILICIVLMFCL